MQQIDLSHIEEIFRSKKSEFQADLHLRLERALSWLCKAAQIQEDDRDMKFLTYWIAFNALYARDNERDVPADRSIFLIFLERICAVDKHGYLYQAIWYQFSDSIRVFLDNPFVCNDFWQYKNGLLSEEEWFSIFDKMRKRVLYALSEKDTCQILKVLFIRIYTLRNQIVHGSTLYRDENNRHQLKDGSAILAMCVPIMMAIMMENHDTVNWGKPLYASA